MVERDDMCSGCGACALVSSRVELKLNEVGDLRPVVSGVPTSRKDSRSEAHRFERVCPGRRVQAVPRIAEQFHPTFGPYVSAWAASATDPEFRWRGSSAGVLTAVSEWLRTEGIGNATAAVASAVGSPSRTVPVTITTRDEALRAAGSRYAPVASLARGAIDPVTTFVGKPCEVSAYRALFDSGAEAGPPLLSFFCAGTPSQSATTAIVDRLGLREDRLVELKYRGEGWPGQFVASDDQGTHGRMDYEDAWGRHLGKQLPWRCKLCPDGTGGSADISVGDFWIADERGFPTFSDADPSSVAIARTHRGHEWLLKAARDGVLSLDRVDLELVAAVQPLQVERKRTLWARMLGRALAGKRVPRYRGFRLLRVTIASPRKLAKGFLGTMERTLAPSSRRIPEI